MIRIKRGATLSLTATFASANGSAFSLSSATITAQICDAERTWRESLPITPTATAGQAQILVPDTSAWPEGLLRADVMVSVNGTQSLSETIGIYVDRPVTETEPGPAPYDPVTA